MKIRPSSKTSPVLSRPLSCPTAGFESEKCALSTMKASTHTMPTLQSGGRTDSRPASVVQMRRRPPRVAIVVACAQRKRVTPRPELRLSSIDGDPQERHAEWLRRISAPDLRNYSAHDLYCGEHWRTV